MRPNEKLHLRFIKLTGIRKDEGIQAFNQVIKLSNENKLSEFYDKNLEILMYFKYPSKFLRTTKNVYISFIKESLVDEIATSEPVTYYAIRKRLNRRCIKLRIKELRNHFASYLRKHNISKEEVDLLQGRIPQDVFLRHYFTILSTSDFKTRVFNAINSMP